MNFPQDTSCNIDLVGWKEKIALLLEEIEVLVNDYGIREVIFNDDVFTVNKKKTEALSDLLIQEIDNPVLTPTKQTKQIQNKARELQELLEPVLDRFYENKKVSSSTFFITLQQKFNYIFDKQYK